MLYPGAWSGWDTLAWEAAAAAAVSASGACDSRGAGIATGGGVVGTGTAAAGSPQPAIPVARFHPPSPLTSPHVDWNVRRIVFGEGL